MRKLILLCSFFIVYLSGLSQPVVYFNFITHNEETSQWSAPIYYANNRARLVSLANYFSANGITWNMQSDWTYLTSVINNDTAYFPTTNNQSILLWMHYDKGVEMDPHAHESTYIYPDVVKLMDSIGLPESKLIGGSIYNDSNGVNIWSNMINGQNGIIFPNKFWQPDYLMGGGTPNHVADLKYYGFWNPQDTANYLVHTPSNHLRHIGVGCEIKIKDTSTVAYIVSQLHDVLQHVQSGDYPPNGFYIQTVFFEQGDLNNMTFYNKVIAIADSMNAMVATGVAQWKTLKQAYTLWDNAGAQMFQWECGQIATGIKNNNTESSIRVYPNPAAKILNVECKMQNAECKIKDIAGRLILLIKLMPAFSVINVGSFSAGVYFYTISAEVGIQKSGKIIVE